MSKTEQIEKSYLGVPAYMLPGNELDWSDISPDSGDITQSTAVLLYNTRRSGAPSYHEGYPDEFIGRLSELAAEKSALMLKNAQGIYNSNPPNKFFRQQLENPKKLTAADKEKYIHHVIASLRNDGVAGLEENAVRLASLAEIPLHQVELHHEKTKEVDTLLAYQYDGKALSAAAERDFTQECHQIHDWVQGEVYNIQFPGPPGGGICTWNITLPKDMKLTAKNRHYEILEEIRGQIEKLVRQRGKYTVTLPYAQPDERRPYKVKFAAKKTVEINVSSLIEVEHLLDYWREFGDVKQFSIAKSKTRER